MRALLAEAEQDDLALAEKSLMLITERGFSRGLDDQTEIHARVPSG